MAKTQGTKNVSKRQSALKKLSVLIPVVMLPLGAWLGYRTFADKSMADIWEALLGIPSLSLALAVGCVAASYLCLTLFDTMGVRYVGHKLPYRQTALTSFISLGIGHTVGVAVLSSGTLRYRLYSGFGLSAAEVGKVVLFCGLTVGLGLLGLAGIALLWRPDINLGSFALAPMAARGVGALCFLLVAAYVLLAWRREKPFSIRGHAFEMPDVKTAAAQVVIGTMNFAFVAGTLHHLLAGAVHYSETIAAYVLANITGLVSHVPGGIGVLEYVISSLVTHGNVVGALIAFRILYFLVPLILAITLLIASELFRLRKS